MATFHEFDSAAIDAAISAAKAHHDEMLAATDIAESVADDGHLQISGGCISVTVEGGKVCLNLPLKIGHVCLPIPSNIPNGTAAQACVNICTTFGIPTGVRVTISVAGVQIISKTFGKC